MSTSMITTTATSRAAINSVLSTMHYIFPNKNFTPNAHTIVLIEDLVKACKHIKSIIKASEHKSRVNPRYLKLINHLKIAKTLILKSIRAMKQWDVPTASNHLQATFTHLEKLL